jgi:DNA invertase Pin-like site-specific DNA recombinase
MRVCIYCRVSTTDGKQTVENQLLQLRCFAQNQGWQVVEEYQDECSGKSSDRTQFKLMFEAASRHEFDLVLFWSLDRFSREGSYKTQQLLQQLDSWGVGFRSFTESFLDTCGIFKEALIALLATLAKQERITLVERTKAGQQRYKRDLEKGTARSKTGKNFPVGRPKAFFDRQKALELKQAGKTLRAIAAELKVSPTTVYLCLKNGTKKDEIAA